MNASEPRLARPFVFLLLVAAATVLSPQVSWAVTEVVTQIDPFSASPTPGVWFENDVRNAGTASIQDLTGVGGALESGAPLPVGAVGLTTTSDDADKAEIGVANDFGLASDIIDASFQLAYSYYKENVGNAFAAPSIKLTFFNFTTPCPSPDADCFITLVYEPTWNQPGNEGSSVAVPTGAWQNVVITDTSGLFWGTGGFGTPNTAGGPPLRTLADWIAVFDGSFGGATLVTVSVGVGTFNQDQDVYFDDVTLFTTGPIATDTTWDFEPVAAAGPGVFVDFYHSNQGSPPVQAGYVGVDGGDASDGTPVVVAGLDVSLASGGVETGGTGIDGRDRGALDPGQALSDLARDFAFAFGEDLILTIDGLAAGVYDWTGYFHDNNVDQGVSTVSLSTDGGVTFPYGPHPTSHSTTTDPPGVATERIRFLADGSSPVVVRISNSDLPTPSVRPILNGFDLVDAHPIQSTRVDWYHPSQGVSPVQAGYVGGDAADASDGTPIDVNGLSFALASQGTESGGTGLSGRDRGALDVSQPLSDLARDFTFAWGEDLVLTIGGTAAGTYVWTGYFHDNNVDHGSADLSVSVDGGSTFTVGPVAYSHSTGTNPPAIGMQSVVFVSDGVSDVVVKMSNPDLPSPSVRPILDAHDLLLLDVSSRHVDFYDSTQGVSPVQAGFIGVDGVDASDGSPVDLGFAQISIASSGTETNGTGTEGRDRGPLDPGQGRSDLARDFVFAWGENLDLTIDGLEAGTYVWSGIFHDSVVDQGAADLSASVDGGTTFTVGPTAFVHSTGTNPVSPAYASLVFTSNGIDPVVVRIANPDLPTPSVRPILNGFTVKLPEPSLGLGLVAGIGLLVGLGRSRRR